MHIIIYASTYTGTEATIPADLASIASVAKKNNPALNITGLLFYHNQKFLQFIEGEKEDLERLLSKIDTDPRNENIKRLIDEPIEDRFYADWNMDYFNLDGKESFSYETLEKIRNIYKANIAVESGIIVDFFKAMIEASYK